MPLDLRLTDIGKRRGLPARPVVLVDDHGAHTLIEIMPMDHARHYAKLHAHARLEVPGFSPPDLRQRKLEAERRFCAYRGGGFPSPFGITTAGHRFAIERGENVLDHVAGKQPINRRPVLHDRSLPRRLGEGSQYGIDRDRPRQALDQRTKARRRDMMGRNPARDRIGCSEPFAGQRTIGAKLPGMRGKNQVAPTSGKKPMPTSGMAKEKRSPATRCEPCTDTPTPPPITMPSISAT